jgi:alpha-1,3-glucosyltransferase
MEIPLLNTNPPETQVCPPSTSRELTFSLLCTLATISPGLGYIAIHPHIKRLPQVFTITALGFFLFSFQVHEKSILLPLLPASLSLFNNDAEERKWTVWINIIGTIRLLPHILD